MLIKKEEYPGISILSINRPEKRNALNKELLLQLIDTLHALSQNTAQRALILKGEGAVFCSGMDLTQFQEEALSLIPKLFCALYNTHLVTCVIVQGAVLAGGIGIISACDYVIAAKNTQFGCPEVRRGVIATNVIPILHRKVARTFLKQLLLQAKTIDAKEAYRMGLIDKIVPGDQLMETALAFVKEVLQGAPNAIKTTKKLIHALEGDLENDLQKAALHSSIDKKEMEEGVAAFLEKRHAKW